ncbi:MAG TPA: FliH/SctL family protein [Clostridia bacterium]|nr:FliH/SctL family protein [Clostridia bacterium]
MYNRIFKNNQVTYGRPYPVQIPVTVHKLNIGELSDKEDEEEEDVSESADPELLQENVKHKCEMMTREAELEADRIIDEARRAARDEAQKITEEAWQKGYAEGIEAAAAQSRDILAQAEEIRCEAQKEHEEMIAGMEEEMLRLVMAAARKVVAGELATDRDVIVRLIRDALPKCSNKEGAVLRVSPDDAENLAENRDELLADIEGADGLEIKKDRTLHKGDCIIETQFGSVDAGVGTRLDRIEEAFNEELSGR